MVNTENDTNICRTCLGYIMLMVYQGFGITYLVENYHSPSQCIASHIWVYVLISLILTLGNGSIIRKYNNRAELLCLLCFFGLIYLGVCTWGGLELMHPSCESSKDNALWKFGFLTFILQTIGAVIYILFACCLGMCGERMLEGTNTGNEYNAAV